MAFGAEFCAAVPWPLHHAESGPGNRVEFRACASPSVPITPGSISRNASRPCSTSGRCPARTSGPASAASRWTTRISQRPSPAGSPTARASGASSSAARASAWRSPPTRSRASAPPSSGTRQARALSRQHNDANIMAIGGRTTAAGPASGASSRRSSPPVSRAAATTLRLDKIAASRTQGLITMDTIVNAHRRQPARDRPGSRRRHPRRGGAPGQRPRADRVGELRQQRGARGRRVGVHEQVRRGLSRAALLRRLRVHRRRRAARHRSREGSCSAPSTPTCSRTRARRPTWPCTSRCSSPATRCSA